MPKCRICTNTENNRSFVVREMMFGFGDKFDYFECSNCAALQIASIPSDLSKYYPQNYYSFGAPRIQKQSSVARWLKRKRATYVLGLDEGRIIGRLLDRVRSVSLPLYCLKRANIGLEQAILDVGCGSGDLLLELHNAGFSNLTGADPYVDNDIYYPNGVRVLKRRLGDLDETYNLVMFHHAFEHMSDPRQVLREVRRLLKLTGCVVVRIPVSGSYAWRVYGEDWVQLDAPRHLFLHTEESINTLAKEVGFAVTSVSYDSTGFQFWGSEQYKRGIPLRDKRSYAENPDSSLFNKDELRLFEEKAQALNESGDGDQACFILHRSDYT